MKTKKLRCVVPSYQIKGKDYSPILRLASKKDSSWHYPDHIIKLLTNPLPLFIFDEIYIDKIAFNCTLNHFSEGSTKLADLLEKIGGLPQVKLYNASTYIGPKVKNIYEDMQKDKSNEDFKWAINVINKVSGEYAWPSNYNFEMINMNITTTLMKSLGGAIPYDDHKRLLLYELKCKEELEKVDKYQTLSDNLKQIRKYHIAQSPIELKTPKEIKKSGKKHNSRELKALRKKLKETMLDKDLLEKFIQNGLTCPQGELNKLVNEETAFRDILATSAIWITAQTAGEKYYLPAMIIFALCGAILMKDLKGLLEKDKYIWYEGLLEVLKYIHNEPNIFASTTYS